MNILSRYANANAHIYKFVIDINKYQRFQSLLKLTKPGNFQTCSDVNLFYTSINTSIVTKTSIVASIVY